jgi:heptosyltransferase-2
MENVKHIDEKLNKVCLIFWGLKGDLFIRIPLVEAIKKHLPDISISVVVDKKNFDVVKDHPQIDEVLTLNRNKNSKYDYYVNILKNIIEIRKKNFDLIINFYSGGSSNLVVLAANAKYKIGFKDRFVSKISNNILVEAPDCPNEHWVFYLAHLLNPLGINPDSVRKGSSFFLEDDSINYATTLLDKYKDKKLVVYNLGAGGAEKCWPVSSFADLSLRLYYKYGIIPVVFTNPGMEYMTEEFANFIDNKIPMIQLPLTAFNNEAAVMGRCYAVITGDTSLMHLAIALKKPTLCVFLETKPENVFPEDCLFVACDLRNNKDKSNINIVLTHFDLLNSEVSKIGL